MNISRLFSAAAAATFFLAIPAPASASECTTEATCARHVVCSPGYAKKSSGGKYGCVREVSAKTEIPTCDKHNSVDDWKWSPSNKECFRHKSNGVVVRSTSNISCSDGLKYDAGSGRCERKGGMVFALPNLSKSDAPGGLPRNCDSLNACMKAPACKAPFALRPFGSGVFCEHEVKVSTRTPSCGKYRTHNDWSWNAKLKMCERERPSGDKVSSAENIDCGEGRYDGAKGLCVMPGRIERKAPHLE